MMGTARTRLSDLPDDQIQSNIRRALGGDPVAMDTLVDDLMPFVHVRVARVLTRRRAQARGRDLRQDLEDLVQDVYAALFADGGKALRRWDPERGLSFEGFVGFVAERVVGMTLRSGRRNPWTEDPTEDDHLAELSGDTAEVLRSLEARDRLKILVAHLRERLTPRGRQYFQLMYIENRPIEDVAKATGASAQALYAWRNRLKNLLRELEREIAAEEARHV